MGVWVLDWQSRQAYTVSSAQILGWDSARVMLAPGQVADGMCLDRDPLAGPGDQGCQVRVPDDRTWPYTREGVTGCQ